MTKIQIHTWNKSKYWRCVCWGRVDAFIFPKLIVRTEADEAKTTNRCKFKLTQLKMNWNTWLRHDSNEYLQKAIRLMKKSKLKPQWDAIFNHARMRFFQRTKI